MPRSSPSRDRIQIAGGSIAVLHWENRTAPRLLFAHANGFCASAYTQMLSQLAKRFDIIAMDLRGHGGSTLPADPGAHHSWDIYADDIAALAAGLERRIDLMAGHSMGASSSLLAAARMDGPPPLALVEPVVLPALMYAAHRTPLRGLISRRIGMGDKARKRTNGWPDRAAAAARYRGRPTFADWAPGMVEDYLRDGLVDAGDTVKLACDPHWEAANFEAQGHNLLKAARIVGDGARVLKAEHRSTVWNASGLTARGSTIEALPGAGHLAPMSDPRAVSDWITRTADHFGL
jgi:pimeloyl-ACP methyl ester carboxylesterase